MRITTSFESGRARIVRGTDPSDLVLEVAGDRSADFRQWFAFAAREAEGEQLRVRIANAGSCTYAGGFEDYQVCASYDRDEWFRVPAEYDGESLVFSHVPRAPVVTYAYYAPYLERRLGKVLRKLAKHPAVTIDEVARSIRGRGLPRVHFASASDEPLRLWIIAQQHPGESMAGWFAEGLLARLANDDDVAERILSRAEVFVVPRMNPDGAAMGHHRTNAAGTDLNRAWLEPSDEASPEVLGVRAAMAETGVDFFLDVHGEEQVPYVFVSGAEGNPHYSDRIEALERMFESAMLETNEAFQTEEGYPKDAPGDGELRSASNYVGERFDCLSMTLEMPFTDDANHPDEEVGWSPERSAILGADTLDAIAALLDDLR
jgi:murein tripeptide amidase MpaA